jgi:hypothetical protein
LVMPQSSSRISCERGAVQAVSEAAGADGLDAAGGGVPQAAAATIEIIE